MSFQKFIREMSDEELALYAQNCSTTVNYIKNHLLHARKIPKKRLMAALVENSFGKIRDEDVFSHFYKKSEKAA